MRKHYEMTTDDLAILLAAMKPMPMVMLQCGAPRSAQESANAAWARLGERMGFDFMTVQPTGQGDRFFSAVAFPPKAPASKPHIKMDGNQWCATWPDFINLQESPAGFGDTPAEAIAELAAINAKEKS